MESSFNLMPVLTTLLQAVPVWAVVGVGFHFWIKSKEKTEAAAKEMISEIKLSVDRIEKQLVHADLQEMKDHVDQLLDQTIEHKVKIDALMKFQEGKRSRYDQ